MKKIVFQNFFQVIVLLDVFVAGWIIKPSCVSAETVSITAIPSLGGVDISISDINDNGQVVGNGTTSNGEQHAFIWSQQAGLTDLSTPGQQSAAIAVNNRIIKGKYWGRRPE